MIYTDDKAATVSFEVTNDTRLEGLVFKLATDGYWVSVSPAKGDKVLVNIKAK